MNRIKKVLWFIWGMYLIPFIAVFITEVVFYGWDFDRSGLFLILVFDYILAYLLLAFLWGKRIKKYISNKYVLFVSLFVLFWLSEILYLVLKN